MDRRLGLLVILAGAPCGWLACNALAGIDAPELRVPEPPADTGVAETAGETSTGCVLAHPPEPPMVDEPGDAAVGSFLVAVQQIGLSIDPPAPPTGFDLDGRCTCPDQAACVKTTSTKPLCDEPGGRDLAMNTQILPVITQSPSFSEKAINDALQLGKYGFLIEVRDYNGGANDSQVQVSIFLSSGTPGDAGVDAAGGRWDIDPTSVVGDAGAGYVSPFVDKTAYVRDSVLVASRLVDVTLALGANADIKLQLVQATMAARIVPTGSSFTLEDGIIAARWPTANVLHAIASLDAPTSLTGGKQMPICKAAGVYAYAKNAICSAADLSTNPARDKDGTAPCDALSFGMRFATIGARFGAVRAAGLGIDGGCGDWMDDCK